MIFNGEFTITNMFDGEFTEENVFDGQFGEYIPISDFEYYTGETTVTPSSETQVLNTNGLMMADNITVNPIPSNYGLITWNGSVLTVS